MTKEELLWEEILQQHGLGEAQGHNPKWLRYGADYFDHNQALSYDTAEKRPNPRTAANIIRAQQLLKLMDSGLSMIKAAKSLGVSKQLASFILRRYRENYTRQKSSTSSEGEI